MRQWWLEIAPGPRWTRVVLMNQAGKTRLRACLPHGPRHPEALKNLIEALGLWCGGSMHIVLAVDGPGAFCATERWIRAFKRLTRLPRYKVEFCMAPLEDRADFADIQQELRLKAQSSSSSK